MGVLATFCQLCALPTQHDDAEAPTWTAFFEELGLPRR